MLYLITTVLACLVLHEVFHYIPHVFWSSRFNYFVLSKVSLGFLIDNDFMLEKKRLVTVFLFPLILSLAFFLSPWGNYAVIFSIINLVLSILDVLLLTRLLQMEPRKRKRWADRLDEKALRTAWYRKMLS